jgi:hypothetical protein
MPEHDAAWYTAKLLAEGYCIIPKLLPADALAALDRDLDSIFTVTPFGQGYFYGFKTKRFGSLPRRRIAITTCGPGSRATTNIC